MLAVPCKEFSTSFILRLEATSSEDGKGIDRFDLNTCLDLFLALPNGAMYSASFTVHTGWEMPARSEEELLTSKPGQRKETDAQTRMKEIGRAWETGCYRLRSDPHTDTINFTILESPRFTKWQGAQKAILKGSLHRVMERD